MSNNPFVLRCYAERKDGLWIAACPQFTLAAQGDTFEEAKGKLEQQIKSYVVEALTIDRANAGELLSRRAPWHVIARYEILVFAGRLSNSLRRRFRSFKEPTLPMIGC